MVQSNIAIILAAGMGTRMKSNTLKPLHKICGKEMLRILISTLNKTKVEKIYVIIPPKADHIISLINNKNIEFIEQSNPNGTCGALIQAKEQIKNSENTLVLYADVPLIKESTINSLFNKHVKSKSEISLITSYKENPKGFGRIIRSNNKSITAIEEDKNIKNTIKKNIKEINVGVYYFKSQWLYHNISKIKPYNNEFLLTDIINIANIESKLITSIILDDLNEGIGINTMLDLSRANEILRKRLLENLMLKGINIIDPKSVYIDIDSVVRNNAILLPNTHISGKSIIGNYSEIGPNTTITNSIIGENSSIKNSIITESKIGKYCTIGPYSLIRDKSKILNNVHIGNNCEIKNSKIGNGTKSSHFSYIGDADIGANVNIGAGTVTCNFDGTYKNKTIIADECFIGSSTMLVAPIKLGKNSKTGAGSVITKDVPPNYIAMGIPAKSKKISDRKK
ncbi:MAG: UDP-N-acetylglucosamine diphosphorylase/glucosamine-1-phosphate N-acetyltransferase [Chloroflexi bacterium]|nr:UDP-N-acetylglucosamine diphosphorylase/glucosamine-1-phosphate N-acetyltransferase [Chloroflexota bacterium]|tara:strand:- start:14343 stop:15701 length:1359 start_codon:yes stop_codon:yes gene_type:complete